MRQMKALAILTLLMVLASCSAQDSKTTKEQYLTEISNGIVEAIKQSDFMLLEPYLFTADQIEREKHRVEGYLLANRKKLVSRCYEAYNDLCSNIINRDEDLSRIKYCKHRVVREREGITDLEILFSIDGRYGIIEVDAIVTSSTAKVLNMCGVRSHDYIQESFGLEEFEVLSEERSAEDPAFDYHILNVDAKSKISKKGRCVTIDYSVKDRLVAQTITDLDNALFVEKNFYSNGKVMNSYSLAITDPSLLKVLTTPLSKGDSTLYLAYKAEGVTLKVWSRYRLNGKVKFTKTVNDTALINRYYNCCGVLDDEIYYTKRADNKYYQRRYDWAGNLRYIRTPNKSKATTLEELNTFPHFFEVYKSYAQMAPRTYNMRFERRPDGWYVRADKNEEFLQLWSFENQKYITPKAYRNSLKHYRSLYSDIYLGYKTVNKSHFTLFSGYADADKDAIAILKNSKNNLNTTQRNQLYYSLYNEIKRIAVAEKFKVDQSFIDMFNEFQTMSAATPYQWCYVELCRILQIRLNSDEFAKLNKDDVQNLLEPIYAEEFAQMSDNQFCISPYVLMLDAYSTAQNTQDRCFISTDLLKHGWYRSYVEKLLGVSKSEIFKAQPPFYDSNIVNKLTVNDEKTDLSDFINRVYQTENVNTLTLCGEYRLKKRDLTLELTSSMLNHEFITVNVIAMAELLNHVLTNTDEKFFWGETFPFTSKTPQEVFMNLNEYSITDDQLKKRSKKEGIARLLKLNKELPDYVRREMIVQHTLTILYKNYDDEAFVELSKPIVDMYNEEWFEEILAGYFHVGYDRIILCAIRAIKLKQYETANTFLDKFYIDPKEDIGFVLNAFDKDVVMDANKKLAKVLRKVKSDKIDDKYRTVMK